MRSFPLSGKKIEKFLFLLFPSSGDSGKCTEKKDLIESKKIICLNDSL